MTFSVPFWPYYHLPCGNSISSFVIDAKTKEPSLCLKSIAIGNRITSLSHLCLCCHPNTPGDGSLGSRLTQGCILINIENGPLVFASVKVICPSYDESGKRGICDIFDINCMLILWRHGDGSLCSRLIQGWTLVDTVNRPLVFRSGFPASSPACRRPRRP